MIRHSEAVLAGHPDKFCDQVADTIIDAAYAHDPGTYAQVEVSTWSDEIWLNGIIASADPIRGDFRELITGLGKRIGYCPDRDRYGEGDGCNHIDAGLYRVTDAVCRVAEEPGQWTGFVNDQSLVIGWAGYDERVNFLPPEHFLAHSLREALDAAFGPGGKLERQGPDGKLLVRLREDTDPRTCRRNTWVVEQVLVSVQHRPDTVLLDLCEAVALVIGEAYLKIAEADNRWRADWQDIELLVNPNGPFLRGGSDGDNGQTGRKLVMDYYGPRVPLGGGALSGKDLTHIDRAGAYAARRACVEAVVAGADTCQSLVAYAPCVAKPLDVRWEGGRPPGSNRKSDNERFDHVNIRAAALGDIGSEPLHGLARGRHFFSRGPSWNRADGPVPVPKNSDSFQARTATIQTTTKTTA